MIWGIILVVFGILFLGVNMNFLDPTVFARIFEFWPLLLVILGVHLIFKKTKIGPFVTVLLILLFGGFVYWAGYQNRSLWQRPQTAVKDQRLSTELSADTKTGSVKVNTGAIKFDISGSTEKLFEGILSSNFMEPKISAFKSGDNQKATITTEGNTPRVWWSGLKNELDLRLSNKVPLDFEVDSGASELNFDFTEINLKSFIIKSGASAIDIKLGNKADQVSGEFNVGASDIKIQIPKGIGARIKADTGITGKSFEGFTQKGDYYENAEYVTATKKIELTIKAGASNIRVNSY